MFINAFLESDVSNFPSQISKISAHILVFFFYSSIVESTITIVDFFKTPIVEIYSTIVEKKNYVPDHSGGLAGQASDRVSRTE